MPSVREQTLEYVLGCQDVQAALSDSDKTPLPGLRALTCPAAAAAPSVSTSLCALRSALYARGTLSGSAQPLSRAAQTQTRRLHIACTPECDSSLWRTL